jgi:ribosomal protein S18 acetylase RimI-like enzyme
MPADAIHDFVQDTVRSFSETQVRVGNWAPDEVDQKVDEHLGDLLPDGAESEGHAFFHIVDAATGQRVGAIWFAERDGGQGPIGYLCDIVVDAPYRGRGYGTAAMRQLEQVAAARGLGLICLDVFAENTIARHLYEGLGYQVMQTYTSADGERETGYLMAKGIEA